MAIVGRDEELHRIVDWLDEGVFPSTDDRSKRPLVLAGEPGIGKTTLWMAGVDEARARGTRCLTARPSLSEAALSHVGLFDLVEPLASAFLPSLPPPQRRPLERALLRAEPGDTELDPRAVALSLTALLRAASREEPILIAVDDAQWLDAASARALAFAMRRPAERVSFLLALRTGDRAASRRQDGFAIMEQEMGPAGMDRILVGPLNLAATHHVLRDGLGATFGRPTLVRIHLASGGNPFYALEIAREVLARGTDDPAEPLPVPANHRDLALLRVRRLPRATRDALLAVAALARPSIADVDVGALGPAERAGIVRVEPDGRVAFAHPLFGSALYGAANTGVRRQLHRMLASKVDSLGERARHLALGADGPDEATARLLDEAAGSAAPRGAPDLAVELAELARRLTPPGDPEAEVRRDLALADRRYFAGDAHGARRELERSFASLPPGDPRAEVLLELGSVVWTQGGIAGLEMFDRALREAESPKLLARIHSRASAFAEDCDVAYHHAEAALTMLDEDEEPFLYGFALHNMALWKFYAGFGADHDAVRRGMDLQRDMASWEMSTVPAFWVRNLDDFATARTRFEDLLRAFREHGDEASTCGITAQLAIVEAMTGHIDRARTLAAEAVDLAEQTGQEGYLNSALNATGQVCVWAGDVPGARAAGRAIVERSATSRT
jgi:AAA ATPase domain